MCLSIIAVKPYEWWRERFYLTYTGREEDRLNRAIRSSSVVVLGAQTFSLSQFHYPQHAGLCPQVCHVKMVKRHRICKHCINIPGEVRTEGGSWKGLFVRKVTAFQENPNFCFIVQNCVTWPPLAAREPGEVFLEKHTASLNKIRILQLRGNGFCVDNQRLPQT